MSTSEQDGTHPHHEVHERLNILLARLEQELEATKKIYSNDIEALAKKCRENMKMLHINFCQELDQLQQKSREQIASLEETIEYLKELNESQRSMMETNMNYLKEMEQRFLSKP